MLSLYEYSKINMDTPNNIKSVQRGISKRPTGATGEFTVTISPVNMNKSIVVLANFDGDETATVSVYLSHENTLTCNTFQTGQTIYWQVIEFY